jgi:SdrD B-like domain
LAYRNNSSNNYTNGNFIDIFPYNGDTTGDVFRETTIAGGTGASNYTDTSSDSTLSLASIPTGTNGEVFQYTTAPSATIKHDPCHVSNQPAGYIPVTGDYCKINFDIYNTLPGGTVGTGTTVWTSTPPADLTKVTAIRFATSPHNSNTATRRVEVNFLPKGNKKGDVYCNSFAGRVPENSLDIRSNDVCVKVVAGTISGTIWKDLDANATATNTQNELPIKLATVKLLKGDGTPYLDALGAAVTTTTDAAGYYEFTNLPSGTYQTEVAYLPSFGAQTFDINTPAINPNNSGNIVLTGPNSNPALLDVSSQAAVNYSYTPPATISGFNYIDANNDGIKQILETPISGTTVTLYKADGITLATKIDGSAIPATVTGINGSYSFPDLAPGTYVVVMSQNPSYLDGKDKASTDVLVNPAGTVAQDDKITNIKVNSGEVSTSNNFGEIVPAGISGYNYVDTNNDGIKDTGETPIAGTLVTLTGGNLPTAGTTTTTLIDGSYSFPNLPQGTYSVTMSQPAGYLDGKDKSGTGSSTPGTTAQNDKIVNIMIYPGEASINNNFGEILPATISGFNYIDTNNNGNKDTGELPIVGTLVTLTGPGLILPLTTNTDINGKYEFLNLFPGTYTVIMAQNPTYLDGKDTAGTGSSTAGNTLINDKISNVVLIGGNNSINNNFGELTIQKITGSIYLNPDNNGTQDPSEPNGSIPAGTTVTITNTTNPAITYIATINPDGTYSQQVEPGTYTVTVTAPIGYTISTSTETGVGIGSNATTITVAAGEIKSQGKDGLYKLNPAIKIDKTIYAGHTAGVGCPGGDELLIVDKTKALKDITYCFVITNTGNTYLKNLAINDPQLSITQANMTLLSGTFPLAPGAKAIWYYQNTTNSSLDNTASTSAIPTNSAGVPTGQSNVTDTDTLAKLIYVFDPPIGIKTGTYQGSNIIRWTMTWINTAAVTAKGAIISDPVPEDSTYNGNLICTGSGVTVVTSCNFEAPSALYPRGRVLVVSDIGSDINGTTAENSNNELQISFDVLVAPGKEEIFNQAKLAWEGFDVPSQAPNTGGATKVTIPKGIEALIRTGGYAVSQNSELLTAIVMIGFAVGLLGYTKKQKRITK